MRQRVDEPLRGVVAQLAHGRPSGWVHQGLAQHGAEHAVAVELHAHGQVDEGADDFVRRAVVGDGLRQQGVGVLADLVEAAREHGAHEALAVAKAEVQRADGGACTLGHGLHGEALKALRLQQVQARVEQGRLRGLAARLQGLPMHTRDELGGIHHGLSPDE